MPPSTWTVDSDTVRTIAQITGLALLVLGWFLVNRQNNRRESRKEARQLIDRAQSHLAAAVDIAAKYQCGSCKENDQHIEGWKLLLALGQIRGSINTLGKKGIDPKSCARPYIVLKRCINGADFMTANWKPWQPDDSRWLELLSATHNLSEAMERLFIDNFDD
jgi:hypothetical protein